MINCLACGKDCENNGFDWNGYYFCNKKHFELVVKNQLSSIIKIRDEINEEDLQ